MSMVIEILKKIKKEKKQVVWGRYTFMILAGN